MGGDWEEAVMQDVKGPSADFVFDTSNNLTQNVEMSGMSNDSTLNSNNSTTDSVEVIPV